MSNITINLKVVKRKSEHPEIRLVCPFHCNHVSKTIDAFRMHLTRNHSNELGIKQVKKQASKLYRLYKESLK